MEALSTPGAKFTPEQIHNALQVISRRGWITPIALAGFVFVAIVYMLLGKIPVTGEGNAVLMERGTVVPFQSNAGGQIVRWHVTVGDVVEAGQVLAELEQPEKSKKIDQLREKLSERQERNRVVDELQNNYTALALKALDQRQGMLTNRIDVLASELEENTGLVERNREQNSRVLSQREVTLQASLDLARNRAQAAADKSVEIAALAKKRRRTKKDALRAEQEASRTGLQVASERLKLLKHYVNVLKAGENYINSQNDLTTRQEQLMDLRLELQSLENQRTDLEKQRLEAEIRRRMEVTDLERQIRQNEKSLAESRDIKSEYAGRVMELTASTGERVTQGTRLGSIDTTEGSSKNIEAVAYFKVKDGKRIEPGMTLRLTPSSVQRERFGSLIATVTEVSDLPVTEDGATAVVGISETARDLTKDGHTIQVFAKLEKDAQTASGFQWDTTSGPEFAVNTGTTAVALANIEERPPLTFVVPILRNWKGFF
ncbi:MAG: NHLP bacteriocin system secretion protein [Pseudomonadota bacterium]